jgi:DNA polymerase I-like protein with 3'-5' exonuclease and polymerase domains
MPLSNLDIVTLDFETFFSADYSLKKEEYNTSGYIRDPQFKVQCVGIKINDNPVTWHHGEAVANALNSIEWNRSALLCHNTAFDGLILSHHYGIIPAFYLDTLSMARALHSNAIKAGLDDVAHFYKVGNKLPNVLNKTKGVRDLPDELMQPLGEYCAEDVRLTYEIFQKMRAYIPPAELELIDITIRMFTDPVLTVDLDAVRLELERELAEQAEIIEKSGYPKKDLTSRDRFAEILKENGIEPPTKISATTGKQTWAFAKNDVDFQALAENESERIRDLYAARLAATSSIKETRAYRFLEAGRDGYRLPVLLKYFGAHTGRWSAGNKMNMQNLPSSRSPCGGALRKAIYAPEGHQIVVCDSSQIEARVNAWLAEQKDLLDDFRNKEDVYSKFGTELYGYTVSRSTPTERHVAKSSVLGLGFGMGAKKMKHFLKVGNPSVEMSIDQTSDIVSFYRNKYRSIPRLWRTMDRVLSDMIQGRSGEYKCLKWDGPFIILPNGTFLSYPFLRGDLSDTGRYENVRYYNLEDGMKLRFAKSEEDVKVKPKFIWGGTLTENVVQALARIIVANQMLEISKKYRVVMFTHDEVVVIAKDDEVEQCKNDMLRIMSTPPDWAPDLPLGADCGAARNYSK